MWRFRIVTPSDSLRLLDNDRIPLANLRSLHSRLRPLASQPSLDLPLGKAINNLRPLDNLLNPHLPLANRRSRLRLLSGSHLLLEPKPVPLELQLLDNHRSQAHRPMSLVNLSSSSSSRHNPMPLANQANSDRNQTPLRLMQILARARLPQRVTIPTIQLCQIHLERPARISKTQQQIHLRLPRPTKVTMCRIHLGRQHHSSKGRALLVSPQHQLPIHSHLQMEHRHRMLAIHLLNSSSRSSSSSSNPALRPKATHLDNKHRMLTQHPLPLLQQHNLSSRPRPLIAITRGLLQPAHIPLEVRNNILRSRVTALRAWTAG